MADRRSMSMRKVTRYAATNSILSELDPLKDVLNLLGYLASAEYVVVVPAERHGILDRKEAHERAIKLRAYARSGLRFAEQALNSPDDVSLLCTYYAILNFIKVYILLGPYHKDLPANRRHGASYLGMESESTDLLSERIAIYGEGAIPLFYKTITGEGVPLPDKCGKLNCLQVQMKDIYPFISGVGAEYHLATRSHSRLATLDWDVEQDGEKQRVVLGAAPQDNSLLDLVELPVVRGGFVPSDMHPERFLGPEVESAWDWKTAVRPHLRSFLLFNGPGLTLTPITREKLLLPEEWPILLAFFHLSNVVRYKPDFFDRLRDSIYWPVVSAARRHCLLKMMILLWNYCHQEELLIGPVLNQQ